MRKTNEKIEGCNVERKHSNFLILAPLWRIWGVNMRTGKNIFLQLNSSSGSLRGNTKETLYFLFATMAGFFLRLSYVLRIPYYVNQHDAGDFTSGHIGYICYLLEHGGRLPDFNPTTVWSFYHPPLHHYLAAFFAKISVLCGADLEQALENVQLLTVFYGLCILLVSYKLLKKFNLSGFALLLPYTLLCVHPFLIMLSGSINNDELCLLLTLLTAYSAILWYEKPVLKRICILALLFAATMLTKMSGLLLAPAVGGLFFIKFLQNRKEWKSMLMQFLAFGLLCIPLSLSFSIRNLILWQVNPFFTLSLGDYMYTGTDPAERFFLLHKEQFASPFVVYNVTLENMLAVDRNIIFYLLKTSLFGDKFFLSADSPYIGIAWGLHAVNLLLILIAFSCMFTVLIRTAATIIKERGPALPIKELFMFFLYGCSMGSFLMFCFKYPNACSQDFRYINLTLFINMIFLGVFLQHTAKNRPIGKIIKSTLVILTSLFTVFTVILFLNCNRIS